MKYNYEYDRKLKICFIGAGGHSYRNIYPSFQYAPVELAAICDIDLAKAKAYARQFGAAAYYTDHREMLEKERPDAVFIVTSYDSEGKVQATKLAMDAMQANAHVWMEKPTASSVQEIIDLIEQSRVSGCSVMSGLKKIFFPAVRKVKEIMNQPEFGKVSSIYVRYPQELPAMNERRDPVRMIGFLDHIYHPAAIIHYLMGRIERFSYEWEPGNGGSVTAMRFESGAVGTLHLCAGISGSSPLERLEVVGQGSNVIIENGVKVSYYRKTQLGPYGRTPSWFTDTDSAPVHWEPEFSLGQLYNKNIFMLGYVPEILHFCESILEGKQPEHGTLQDSLEIMRLYEAFRTTEPGTPVVLPNDSVPD